MRRSAWIWLFVAVVPAPGQIMRFAPVADSLTDPSSVPNLRPSPVLLDSFGGWLMWWSLNAEEFLDPADAKSGGNASESNKDHVTPATPEMIRAEVIPVLMAALRDDDREVRDSAAIALGRSGDARDVGALITALPDTDRT